MPRVKAQHIKAGQRFDGLVAVDDAEVLEPILDNRGVQVAPASVLVRSAYLDPEIAARIAGSAVFFDIDDLVEVEDDDADA